MKNLLLSLLTLTSSLLTLSAAVPLKWYVETSHVSPVTFEAYQGETLSFEAALQSYGKPLAAPSEYALYWQTNGMGSTYWSVPCSQTFEHSEHSNILYATWSPTNDVGARVYNCFIGKPGTIYHAAFQLRLRPSPGATPNELPLPTPVIDFAKVTVLNPPWSGGGVDTNTVREIVRPMIEGSTNGLRRVEDRTVYETVRTENTDWTLVGNDGITTQCTSVWIGEGFSFFKGGVNVAASDTTVSRDAKTTTWEGAPEIGYSGVATRTSYMDESIAPNPDQQLASVTTNGAGAVSSGDLVKYDAANDRLVQAVAGVDYMKEHQDISGKLDAYHDFDGEPASVGWEALYLSVRAPNGLYVLSGDVHSDEYDSRGTYIGTHSLSQKADREELEPLSEDIRAAYKYAKAVSLYMTGNTNAWFAGTNYVFGADAETRTHFSWEDGMDSATVPCSMALWELRDGVRQCVWDQRDWTAWYWSFKAQQMRGEIAATNRLLYATITNAENHAWAKHYAATGRRNPDASTTFIDTPSVTLSPGMSWETVATVGGCGYWTIVGNGAVIGGSGTNATLNVKDFEGNSILEITKGQHMLAWLESGDFIGQMTDSDGWICFDMMADVKPTGYFSTTLVAADFVAETDADCPAQYRWENLGGHVWRVHFLLKPGIVSDACFSKFMVEVEGRTQIRYNADTVINGGLIFEGVKIAPVIQAGAAVGSTVTWKVVQ